MTRDEAIKTIGEAMDEIVAEFPVRSLGVFGSTVRNEANDGSDVDILVTFSEPVGLFTFSGLRLKLVDLLGCDVDLVSRDAVRPEWRDRIYREAVYVVG